MKKIIVFSLVTIITLVSTGLVSARDCDGNPPTNKEELNSYIESCYAKLNEIAGQKQTLSQAISYLSNQISLTQAKIIKTQSDLNDLETEITDLTGKINSIDYSLTDLTKLFVARVRETYISRDDTLTNIMAQTSGISSLIRNLAYTKRVRDNDRQILVALEKSRLDYNAQKEEKEKKQQQVATLKASLDQQKSTLAAQVSAKNKLLADTKNDEKRYQSLLSQAQAQLRSLANYARSVGITLVPHQELSDSWGKYYNQRDEQWGKVVINNSYDCGTDSNGDKIPCSVALVGCLITSYSMVSSHYGGSVLPSDVANNSSNFYSSTAFFNSPGPSANGHSATSIDNPSSQQLRDALNSGKSVIAGMSMNGGPYPTHYSDHWVVLRSVDGDSFKINDPEYPGAMNVSIKDHYASWTIIQARIYD